VYLTDALAVEGLRPIELPIDLEPNVYVGAVLEGAPAGAISLFDFIASAPTEAIWRDAGFEVVGAP
jgi:hypothetical protein